MQYFISWTNIDPEFQQYDKNCNILLSPKLLYSNWDITKWKTFPKRLFIDSGVYTAGNREMKNPEEILQDQIYICKKWPDEKLLYLSHPDVILPYNITYKECQKLINLNLERAKIYFDLINRMKRNLKPIGVIHGLCEEDILNSFYELVEIGYSFFALGSLGIRLSKNRRIVLDLLNIVNDYCLDPIHIFGITIPLIQKSSNFNFASYDTSTPIKLAYFGTVLYGTPLKRYLIAPSKKQIQRDKNFSFRIPIEKPMFCNCPICIINPNALLEGNANTIKYNRIIHNYFLLKWSTTKQQ